MVLVLKWPFFETFFFSQYSPGKCFYNILEQKNACLGYRNKILKKSKNWSFSKLFFLGNIGQENVFYDILEQKNACLGFKNKMLKKSKNWHFSKGVNSWVWSKNGHYSNFFFVEYRPGKVLLRYCTTKKRSWL